MDQFEYIVIILNICTLPLMRKKRSRRLCVSLTEDDYTQLQKLSEEKDRSLSWIVSHAIAFFLKNDKKPTEQENRSIST